MRLPEVCPDQFIPSFDTLHRHLTFDLHALGDSAHGHQHRWKR
jgi:hypothetical protein